MHDTVRPFGLIRLAGFALLYALLGWGCVTLLYTIDSGTGQFAWPGSGIAVAALLLGGRRYAAAIFAGAWLGGWWLGTPAAAAAGIAFGTALEALCILWLLRTGRDFDASLGKLNDYLHLLLAGGCGALLGASLGVALLWAAGLTDTGTPAHQFAHWWMSDMLGIVLVTPLILVWRQWPEWRSRGCRAEALLVLGATFLIGQIVFLDWFPGLSDTIARGYWLFLFVCWAALRLGSHGALLILLLVATQGLAGIHFGTGFFGGEGHAQLAAYWGYILVLSITGIALATYLQNLRRTRQAQLMAEAELRREHELLEIRVRERTAELAMSEARTRAVLHSMADGVIQIDAQGIIRLANHAGAALFGYEVDDLIGQKVNMLMPEPYRSAHDGYIFRYLSTRVPHVIGQYREVEGLRQNGDSFPLEFNVNELVDDQGITFIAVLRDLTQQHEMEAAREAAHREAQRLARMKSDFLANMSHEIRTPLGAMMGLARIGMRENRGRQTHDTCARILDSGEHLLALVNDILDFSKIEAGKLTVEARPMQLAAVIEESIGMVSDRASAKGIAIDYWPATHQPAWVMGDPLRLRQILVNLLANAVKFTARGRVDLTVLHNAGQFWFAVRDEGIGMTLEQVERLFQPFEQADASTTRQYGGSGLGLAISQNLAQLMGGKIEVMSQFGEGSTFTLRLPLPETTAPPDDEKSRRWQDGTAGSPSTAGPRLAGLSLLAAEDVEINRYILEDLLESEGARVVFAVNGKEAVEQVACAPDAFDAVLMDVQMPVMDGHEAARHLRKIAPDLPIIGLTAHALKEERTRCLEAGMVDHVTKPIDPDTLVAAILRLECPARTADAIAPGEIPAQIPLETRGPACGIDWQVLETRHKNKPAFIRKLLQAVLDSHSATPGKLRGLAENRDFDALAFLAHNLKGTAGNLAAIDIQTLAAATETSARKHEADSVDLAIRLAGCVTVMIADIQDYLRLGDAP
ncbi:MAG: ATP-binding protein [Rhodocyclaceae bacterium]|nr:ATP-binding protein [Rhodocyclaceae bacterium]